MNTFDSLLIIIVQQVENKNNNNNYRVHHRQMKIDNEKIEWIASHFWQSILVIGRHKI